jgi:hypothetical protein
MDDVLPGLAGIGAIPTGSYSESERHLDAARVKAMPRKAHRKVGINLTDEGKEFTFGWKHNEKFGLHAFVRDDEERGTMWGAGVKLEW